MNRIRKTPGRIAFVGSGPGDAGLLTLRAKELLTTAELVVTDPDVPAGVTALTDKDAEVRPAVGEPGDVAKDLVTEAKSGRGVVRLVSGDPLTADAVVKEVHAVAKTSVSFDVVPGVPAGTAVSAYAGVALVLRIPRWMFAAKRSTGPDWPQHPAHWCCMPPAATSPRRRPCWWSTAWRPRPRSR